MREAYKIIKKRGAVGQEVLVWFGVKHGQPRSVIAVIVEMIDIMIHLDSERYGRVCAGAYKDHWPESGMYTALYSVHGTPTGPHLGSKT